MYWMYRKFYRFTNGIKLLIQEDFAWNYRTGAFKWNIVYLLGKKEDTVWKEKWKSKSSGNLNNNQLVADQTFAIYELPPILSEKNPLKPYNYSYISYGFTYRIHFLCLHSCADSDPNVFAHSVHLFILFYFILLSILYCKVCSTPESLQIHIQYIHILSLIHILYSVLQYFRHYCTYLCSAVRQ